MNMAKNILNMILSAGLVLSMSATAYADDKTAAKKPAAVTLGDLKTDLDLLRKDMGVLRTDFMLLVEQLRQLNVSAKEVLARGRAESEPKEVKRITLINENEPTLGNSDAKIAIVEFSDFQCPFCRRFHQETFPQLKHDYIDTGKVQLIYRDVPLENHPHAKLAAIAASCAGAQNQYWQAADALFEPEEITEESIRSLDVKLGLDKTQFSACLADAKQLTAVESDRAYAKTLGIDGTPTFYVGRIEGNKVIDARPILGAQPYAAFAEAIDSYLQ